MNKCREEKSIICYLHECVKMLYMSKFKLQSAGNIYKSVAQETGNLLFKNISHDYLIFFSIIDKNSCFFIIAQKSVEKDGLQTKKVSPFYTQYSLLNSPERGYGKKIL